MFCFLKNLRHSLPGWFCIHSTVQAGSCFLTIKNHFKNKETWYGLTYETNISSDLPADKRHDEYSTWHAPNKSVDTEQRHIVSILFLGARGFYLPQRCIPSSSGLQPGSGTMQGWVRSCPSHIVNFLQSITYPTKQKTRNCLFLSHLGLTPTRQTQHPPRRCGVLILW